MNIHPGSPLSKSVIKRIAITIGLSEIDYNESYDLIKLGAKNQSELGYPDKMTAFQKGKVYLVGNTDKDGINCVWLIIENISSWFKTSPILSCKKSKNNSFLIETQNSYYKLVSLKEKSNKTVKQVKKMVKKGKTQ